MANTFDIARIGALYPKQKTVPVVGSGIIKAGTPINANGEVTTGEDAIGLLRYDVNADIGQRGVIVVEGVIDAKAAQEHAGVTYTSEVAGALPGIALAGIADIPGGGVAPDYATDAEVDEALDTLYPN